MKGLSAFHSMSRIAYSLLMLSVRGYGRGVTISRFGSGVQAINANAAIRNVPTPPLKRNSSINTNKPPIKEDFKNAQRSRRNLTEQGTKE